MVFNISIILSLDKGMKLAKKRSLKNLIICNVSKLSEDDETSLSYFVCNFVFMFVEWM